MLVRCVCVCVCMAWLGQQVDSQDRVFVKRTAVKQIHPSIDLHCGTAGRNLQALFIYGATCPGAPAASVCPCKLHGMCVE